MASRCLVKKPGVSAMRFLICLKRISSSSCAGILQHVLASFGAGAEQDVHGGVAAINRGSCWTAHRPALEDLVRCRSSSPRAVSPLTAKTGTPVAAMAAAA